MSFSTRLDIRTTTGNRYAVLRSAVQHRLMDLKHKILALTVLPLLLAMVAIGALVQHRSTQLAEQQVALIEETFC